MKETAQSEQVTHSLRHSRNKPEASYKKKVAPSSYIPLYSLIAKHFTKAEKPFTDEEKQTQTDEVT